MKVLKGENEAHKSVNHQTVFHNLLDSNLPAEEKSPMRLHHEAAGLIAAAIETTKSTLSVASFHLLDKPKLLQKLRDELQEAFPDPSTQPTISELERLPYLTAVLKEGE